MTGVARRKNARQPVAWAAWRGIPSRSATTGAELGDSGTVDSKVGLVATAGRGLSEGQRLRTTGAVSSVAKRRRLGWPSTFTVIEKWNTEPCERSRLAHSSRRLGLHAAWPHSFRSLFHISGCYDLRRIARSPACRCFNRSAASRFPIPRSAASRESCSSRGYVNSRSQL